MEKFKALLDLQIKHRSALGYGLVTLLTAGGEKIFSTGVFQCPCTATWNLTYGLVFLLVPALALFLLGYALRARTWRLLPECKHIQFGVAQRTRMRAAQRGRSARSPHLGGRGATWGLLLSMCCQREHTLGDIFVQGPQPQLHCQATSGSLQQAGGGDAGDPESAQGPVSGQALREIGRLRGATKKSVTFL